LMEDEEKENSKLQKHTAVFLLRGGGEGLPLKKRKGGGAERSEQGRSCPQGKTPNQKFG